MKNSKFHFFDKSQINTIVGLCIQTTVLVYAIVKSNKSCVAVPMTSRRDVIRTTSLF